VVTDRDMYIALATQNARAAQLRVGAVATKTVATCVPEDDVQSALAAMRQARVRRLPVVGFGNTVVGMAVDE
jgi:CBS domain-containing protein